MSVPQKGEARAKPGRAGGGGGLRHVGVYQDDRASNGFERRVACDSDGIGEADERS